MTTQSQSILATFNEHFIEFVNDIVNVFPDNTDILSAKNSLILMRKANPKILIKIWVTHIVGKYQSVIEEGDLSFFINKDYNDDFTNTDKSSKIIEAIDRLRTPIKMMTEKDQQTTMKYIQNLTKLSKIYENLEQNAK